MRELGVASMTELRVVGGASRNGTLRRVLADAFQLRLRFPAEPESAALGAAMQAAAVCAGEDVAGFCARNDVPLEDLVVEPDPASAQAYGKAFDAFQSYGKLLYANKN